jgi:hypothetical protein
LDGWFVGFRVDFIPDAFVPNNLDTSLVHTVGFSGGGALLCLHHSVKVNWLPIERLHREQIGTRFDISVLPFFDSGTL